jgi:hypothetical protein
MFARYGVLALAAAFAACATTGTEPTLSEAKAAKPATSYQQAYATGFFQPPGLGAWVLVVARYATKGQRPDSTTLLIEHCGQDCQSPEPQERTTVFNGPIPDEDFKVGRWHRDWELHTTVAGHGSIDLTFNNEGDWTKSQYGATQDVPSGLTGTVFGMDVAPGYVILFFDPTPSVP